MTTDELRSLADEAADRGIALRQPVYMNEAGQKLWRAAPDLARLCAEMGEALELLWAHYLLPMDIEKREQVADALAKLSELKS